MGTNGNSNQLGIPNKERIALQGDEIVLSKILGNEMLGMGFLFQNTDNLKAYTKAQQLFPEHNYTKSAWYDYIIESNVVVNTAIEQRFNGVLNLEYELVQYDETPLGQEIQDVVENALYERNLYNFAGLLKHMLTAEYRGFSVAETVWDYKNVRFESGGNKLFFLPTNIKFWKSNHFEFTGEGDLRQIDRSGGNYIYGDPLNMMKYIIHKYNASSDNPEGKSIIGIRGIWLVWIRSTIMKKFLEYCDRHGIPPFVITVPMNVWQSKELDSLRGAASDLYTVKNMIIPEGSDLRIVETAMAKANMFMDAIKYIDSQLVLNILGQSNTTSSDGGGSYARDQVSYDIIKDIAKSSSKSLEETINNQFIRRIIEINFPYANVDYPYFQFTIKDNTDLEKESRIIQSLVGLGMEVSKTQVREIFNLVQPVDEDDILVKPEPQQVPLFSEHSIPKKKSR